MIDTVLVRNIMRDWFDSWEKKLIDDIWNDDEIPNKNILYILMFLLLESRIPFYNCLQTWYNRNEMQEFIQSSYHRYWIHIYIYTYLYLINEKRNLCSCEI